MKKTAAIALNLRPARHLSTFFVSARGVPPPPIWLAAEVAADVDYGMEAILLARLSEYGEQVTG